MEDKCRMCGQCCRSINIDAQVCWDIKNGKESPDYDFVRKNWEYLGSSKDVGGFVGKEYDGQPFYYGVYRCNLISDDNKCTIHKDKPRVCSGYPWYDDESGSSFPWPYVGCGYEKDSHLRQLVKVFKLIRDKKQGELIETKRKEGKSYLLSVREA